MFKSECVIKKTRPFFWALLLTVSCTTPSRLGINYKGEKIFISSNNPVENPNIYLTVNPLSNQDAGYDIKLLKNRLVPFVYKNEVLASLIQKYPDLKIDIEITPSEKIKRTWIFDAAFFSFCAGWLPITPCWGSTDLSAKMTVSVPDAGRSEFKFISSEPFKILFYSYYRGGRILTEKYSNAYNKLFSQIGSYNFDEIAAISGSNLLASNTGDTRYSFKYRSDIDKDIPDLAESNMNRFALIIGNEDYSSQQTDLTAESNVEFARNDASAFKEYANHTLGIPDGNIDFILDATTGKMKQALSKLSLLAKNSQGNAELYFYYAGHGLPDEINKEPYLIPVDISGKNVTDGIKLTDAYKILTEYTNKRVTVFLDACFSGGARNQGLISTRGVKIKPKEDPLIGNLVVFTAGSGEQSSLAYSSQEHGLFTYYLLKKLKESKADVTYREMSDYLIKEVGLNSVRINSKEQNPQINVSPTIEDQWQGWKFR